MIKQNKFILCYICIMVLLPLSCIIKAQSENIIPKTGAIKGGVLTELTEGNYVRIKLFRYSTHVMDSAEPNPVYVTRVNSDTLYPFSYEFSSLSPGYYRVENGAGIHTAFRLIDTVIDSIPVLSDSVSIAPICITVMSPNEFYHETPGPYVWNWSRWVVSRHNFKWKEQVLDSVLTRIDRVTEERQAKNNKLK